MRTDIDLPSVEMEWFTSLGNQYTGQVHSVDARKRTAKYEVPDPCHRCGGAGGGDQWKYTGYTCFECGGHGFRSRTRTCRLYSADKYTKLAAARTKREATLAAKRALATAEKEAKRSAERAERVAEFEASHPGFAERLRSHMDGNGFLSDLHAKLTEAYGYLSDAQVNAAEMVFARVLQSQASVFISGEIGDRVTLTLTVERVIIPDVCGYSRIPPSWTYLCRDEAGNKVVYRGRSDAMPYNGETAQLIATIKEFNTFNGTKQTVIARPKSVAVALKVA